VTGGATGPVSRGASSPAWSVSLGDRVLGRHPDIRSLSVALIFGCLLLGAGLIVVAHSRNSGFTWAGAVEGVSSQIAVTGPAACLVAAATFANVLAGAIVLRLLGTPPFRTLSDLVLAGFCAAVVLDTATLFLLGGPGLFGWPELVVLHLAIGAVYLLRRGTHPLLASPIHMRTSRPAAWWPLVLALWAGPLIVQLASPAVPFMDVLPNHIAPVEHVRVFGSFATLTTSPSPLYGPSRLLLGYIGLLGGLTTATGLEAVLAVAAFALPLTLLLAVSLRHLATALFGKGAGYWVLLTFPLTFAFMRIPDARGTVVVFPIAAWALACLAGELRARPGSSTDALAGRRRPDVALTAAFGAAVLVHPLIGIVLFAAAAALLAIAPGRLAARLIPVLIGGAVIALPQLACLLGLGAPSWVGFVCIAAALPAAFVAARVVSWTLARIHRLWVLKGIPLAIAAVALVTIPLVVARIAIGAPDDPWSELYDVFPRLLLACCVGVLLSTRRLAHGWIVLACGMAAGGAAWAASGLVPQDTLTGLAVKYEVPKAIEYWLPVMLALGAAAGLASVCRLRRLGMLRPVIVAAFMVVSLYPITGPLISSAAIGEHRGAESLGLALKEAERGYWDLGFPGIYPDSRRIIDAPRQEVVDALRAEIDAGRLGPSTRVLHVALSFQQWFSVPIAVFAGPLETSISRYPELSIHTEGGRLYGLDRLDGELATGYGYVVLEPYGMPPDLPIKIVAAGYHPIWSNSLATIYAQD
jgi:hypothetical protein